MGFSFFTVAVNLCILKILVSRTLVNGEYFTKPLFILEDELDVVVELTKLFWYQSF